MFALLALVAAAGWGSSDYAAGRAARRSGALSVVIGTHLTAAIVLLVASLDPLGLGMGSTGGPIPRGDLLWGLAAGVCGGIGALFLYRGLARGSAAVVAPVTAAGAALIPAVFGLLTGGPVGALTICGIAASLLAIVMVAVVPGADSDPTSLEEGPDELLVQRAGAAIAAVQQRQSMRSDKVSWRTALTGFLASALAGGLAAGTWAAMRSPLRTPSAAIGLVAFAAALLVSTFAVDAGRSGRKRSGHGAAGLGDALLSGAGFALFFILSSNVGDTSGLWPMAIARAASSVVFAVAALALGSVLVPAVGTRGPVILAGLLDGVAAGAFLIAIGDGSLAVVSVLSSLYPIATVLLARVIDRERCHRGHLIGLVIAAVAVAMLATA